MGCIPAGGLGNPGGEIERQHLFAEITTSIEHHPHPAPPRPAPPALPPTTAPGQREDLSTSMKGENGKLLTSCLDVAKGFLFGEYWM